MGHGKVCLELLPSFVAGGLSPPQLAIFRKHACFENQVVGGGSNLFGWLWVISRSCHIDCVVNLFDENLHWLVHIIIRAHALFILFEIAFGDFSVSGVEVSQHFQGGYVGVTDLLVTEGTYISLVDGGDQQGFKGLFSAVVFTIQFCIHIMLEADAADLRSSATVGDGL